MSNYKTIIDEFNEALRDVANVWKEQKNSFSDPKIEEFGVSVLQPLSLAGGKINQQAQALDDALQKLKNKGLI